MLEAIGEAHSAGKFIYAMKSLAGGNFVSEREKALRFVFGQERIDAAVVGMVTPPEVEWNVRFLSGLPIADELLLNEPGKGRPPKTFDLFAEFDGFLLSDLGRLR
jgi:hypothetical protein